MEEADETDAEAGAEVRKTVTFTKTYQEAKAFCSAQGARLCSMSELRYDVANGIGCNLENNLI